MSDNELIRLKKEIHHLRERNADLEAEIDEKNNKLGQLESDYLKMKNETLLVTKTKLMQQQEIIKHNVEKAIDDERNRYIEIERNLEESLKKIRIFEQENKNLEMHRKELQVQNNMLRKQINEYGQKYEVTDFIKQINEIQDDLFKKDQEYQKLVVQWNELCDKMEDVLVENRLLRETAQVPANYGIDIEKIKIGDRVKIEDYKAKIRILQREIDSLETERAQLKHKILFMSNSLEMKEPPFSNLSIEQKKSVAEYAQALFEKRDFIVPERYELIKDNDKLKIRIEYLEKQIQNLQTENAYRLYGIQLNRGGAQNFGNKFMDILKKDNDELRAMIKNKLDDGSVSLQNETGGNYGFNKNNNYNNISNNTSLIRDDQRMELNYLQIPPQPLIDHKDIDNTGYGLSYKFNTKLKIDPSQIHALFGIAKNDTDIESFKIESASLQVQLIETLEILDRIKNHDESLNDNLVKLYDKLENIVLIQNELFERYTKDKQNYENQINLATKKNKELIDDLHDFRRKDKALEDTLRLLETKDINLMEKRAIEKMREIAILDVNYIKLSRKYECLYEEENKLKKYIHEMENNSIEKDSHLENTIIKLKEWKQMLTFYLKFLMKKLKNSVERNEFEKILEENRYLREKQHEMIIRDIDITKKISTIENYRIKLKELEKNFFSSEEIRIDSDIELNYLKRRLQELDPEFNLQETLFRKFIKSLNELEISFHDIKRVFDPNNNGSIDKLEFINAINSLKLNFSGQEITLLVKSLNFIDERDNIDIYYFIRKLERSGIEQENGEEEVLSKFIENIKNSGLSLKSVFELFDSTGDGIIGKDEFKFALNQLNLNISEETISKILHIITGDIDIDTVNYNQFCEIFDSKTKYLSMKNKKNNQVKCSLKIDWKTNLFASIVESVKRNGMSFKQAFDILDLDKTGSISKIEFTHFMRKINVNFSEEEIDSLFNFIDNDNNGVIKKDEFIRGLEECQIKIDLFRKLLENEEKNSVSKSNLNFEKSHNNFNGLSSNFQVLNSFNTNSNKLAHKSILLEEKEKYYNYKIQQMRLKIDELEKNNNEISKQMEEYASKHINMSEKYFDIMEESSKLKTIYDLSITREELQKIENHNDQLSREVTILRVGLNTFKDLYKSSCKQIKCLNLNYAKNSDEIDTYKKAMKELQSESNSQALIGKLYYSLLISRWRESSSIKKYDDLINDLSILKEDNYKIETNNSSLVKEVTELQTIAHEKIIENIRLEDSLQNYTKPIITVEQLDELKSLVRDISLEKTNLTEKYFEIRRENLRLITDNDELRNKIDYSNALISRVKVSCNDEYSIRLLEISEELSKVKLNESIFSRENIFLKEGEIYLNRIIEHANRNIKNLETSNSEWELKYRKAEEIWRKKDEERQKKFFEQLKKMSLDELRFGNKGNTNLNSLNLGNIGSTNYKPSFANLKSKENNNINLNLEGYKLNVKDLENKILQMQDTLNIKNNEILKLENLINETQEALKNSHNLKELNLADADPYRNLLSSKHMEIIQEDETRMVAQTAHKTIKTLQDLLESKNQQIYKKDEIIEQLKNNLIKNKEIHLNQVSSLQDQIHTDHQNTMNKLKSVIESVNSNLIVKISKNQLSTMTLNDIENLIDEKDSNLKLLAVELKSSKEQNEFLQLKIFDLNKRIGELSTELNEERLCKESKTGQMSDITKLKNIIKEKSELIEEEKERIKLLREEFSKRMDDKYNLEEKLFQCTANVPERLVENNDKALMFNKLQSLRNKNKKLLIEIENLNKKIEENKTKYSDADKKIELIKQENKIFLSTQAKDTKIISRLKKEKDEFKEILEKLKEENENLKRLLNGNILNLSNISQQSPKQPIIGNAGNIQQNNVKKRSESRSNLVKKEADTNSNTYMRQSKPNVNIYNKNPSIGNFKNKEKEKLNNSYQINNLNCIQINSPQDSMKKLIEECLKSKINMTKYLQKYDLTNSGILGKINFSKAIDELNIGISGEDVNKILVFFKIYEENIKIEDFTKVMIDFDSSYKDIIINKEDFKDGNNKNIQDVLELV